MADVVSALNQLQPCLAIVEPVNFAVIKLAVGLLFCYLLALAMPFRAAELPAPPRGGEDRILLEPVQCCRSCYDSNGGTFEPGRRRRFELEEMLGKGGSVMADKGCSMIGAFVH
ncbi:hypothetical protein BRADI_4g03263v3 [Brachypodium distachyon]|uniref:Uncharacterized protein n=1 Tax=Brachypodium distachyon TaxID=15368 RepID=A0A2K2CK78_BRADI|nr:hypothetical protein BRADI_4g03263v3 [Brachypodium distachyon]